LDLVCALQHALYRAAKADPGDALHALYDKVYRRDVLERAWQVVRRNRGAPGIDQTTIQQVERYGVDRLLDQLAARLKDGSYQPRRHAGCSSQARHGRAAAVVDPAVADWIVQAAVKLVAEPIFEADMLACSFGFCPRRSAHEVLQVLIDEAWRGRRWVVETDIANCFEAIPHEG
jgi:RNA-directed DNA polymerase